MGGFHGHYRIPIDEVFTADDSKVITVPVSRMADVVKAVWVQYDAWIAQKTVCWLICTHRKCFPMHCIVGDIDIELSFILASFAAECGKYIVVTYRTIARKVFWRRWTHWNRRAGFPLERNYEEEYDGNDCIYSGLEYITKRNYQARMVPGLCCEDSRRIVKGNIILEVRLVILRIVASRSNCAQVHNYREHCTVIPFTVFRPTGTVSSNFLVNATSFSL